MIPGWLHFMAKVALMDEHWKKYWYDRLLGRKYGKVYVLDRSDIPMGKCEDCGAKDELRPIGPRGEWICYDCGRKDPEAVEAAMKKIRAGRKARRKGHL